MVTQPMSDAIALAVSVATTQQEMAARVAASGTSFAAGMAVLSPPRRAAMHALYAFCRVVDDIADDLPNVDDRVAGLALWREHIHALFEHGESRDPVTTALQPAIQNYGLVADDFYAIIDGMAMDAAEQPIVAPDAATLDLYCDRVASAVGRISVRIFGDASPMAMQVSHHLGRALQLTNILRDLHEDAQRGRLYLPGELLVAHGVPITTAAVMHNQLPLVCHELAQQAAAHFAQAARAMAQCDQRAMLPARLMSGYYHAILRRLVQGDWRDIKQRVRLPWWQKLWLVCAIRCGARL